MEIKEYGKYSPEEILPLYADVGRTAYTQDPQTLQKGFENSLLVLAAYENDRLIGIIRVVGDGHTVVYVQDLLVLRQYQRRGIGSALLKAILVRYAHVRQVLLATDDTPQTVAFYEKIGLRRLSDFGCCSFMKV